MEKNSRIVVFGDSIAKGLTPYLEKLVFEKFKNEIDYNILFFNYGGEGETSNEGLARINKILDLKPTVVIINFGMNDWRKGISTNIFENNLETMINKFLECNIRVIVNTINPDNNGISYRFSQPNRKNESKEISIYNSVILKICNSNGIRIANIYEYWKRYFKETYLGLEDSIHPNPDGYRLISLAILPVLIRTQMLILWQFNGRYAHCNYACPYCYVPTSVNKGMHFNFTIQDWEKAFEKHFGNMPTVFYLSYGEPTIASEFYDVIDMIGRHPNWEVKITSNISLPLDKLLNTKVSKESRLNINASFHPTQITIEKFLEKCSYIRKHGIEPSIIYVMYPPQLDDFEKKYLDIFRQNGYVVHIRAFRGLYKGKKYPGAYTDEQWKKVAKYMDKANLKYQLGEVNGLGRLTMLGMTHILVDNIGRIEMCDSYVGDSSYGNLFDEKINLSIEPVPFPGLVPLAAVDDIADYVELGFKDLTGNNVLNYARQGGVYKNDDGQIIYPFEYFDFSNEKKRRESVQVPDPFRTKKDFWLNIRWFFVHFIYSFLIKKYGKYIYAWFVGKYKLLKKGKLRKENFWHS